MCPKHNNKINKSINKKRRVDKHLEEIRKYQQSVKIYFNTILI